MRFQKCTVGGDCLENVYSILYRNRLLSKLVGQVKSSNLLTLTSEKWVESQARGGQYSRDWLQHRDLKQQFRQGFGNGVVQYFFGV